MNDSEKKEVDEAAQIAIRVVSNYYEMSEETIMSKSKREYLVNARAWIYYLTIMQVTPEFLINKRVTYEEKMKRVNSGIHSYVEEVFGRDRLSIRHLILRKVNEIEVYHTEAAILEHFKEAINGVKKKPVTTPKKRAIKPTIRLNSYKFAMINKRLKTKTL